MAQVSHLAAAIGITACFQLPTANPTTYSEVYLLDQVKRHAAYLHLPVKGMLVEYYRVVPAGTGGCPKDSPQACKGVGWFDYPLAYFYRGYVNAASTEDLSNLSAHEVCHAESLEHDQLHRNCMLLLGANPDFAPEEF